MEYIYAPWRSDYFSGKREGCVFCDISSAQKDDEKNHVFYRDELFFMVMNKYPYTPGHFLIVPHEHVANPLELNDEAWMRLALLTKKGIEILMRLGSEGVNAGINIHKSAGAGIPDHLHVHLVPRFAGDTNFITAIGDSRVYGVDFEEVFKKVKSVAKEVLC